VNIFENQIRKLIWKNMSSFIYALFVEGVENQVGSNGFCFDCQSYNDVVEKLDNCDIDRLTLDRINP
jgi:hypothetical protein